MGETRQAGQGLFDMGLQVPGHVVAQIVRQPYVRIMTRHDDVQIHIFGKTAQGIASCGHGVKPYIVP